MKITYIYHSCFLIETDEYSMVFDYWQDPTSSDGTTPRFLQSLDRTKPFYVVVSHHHKDHFNPAIFSWGECHPDVRFVISREVERFARHYLNPASHYKGRKPNPEKVTVMKAGETHSDGIIEIEAFGSTDCGCSWLIRPEGKEKQTADEQSIFHAGDLNAWIWIDESTEAEVNKAIGDYKAILNKIAEATERIGYCLFPVDSRIGTHWYMGAEMIVRKIRISHFFPMHFTLADSEAEKRQRIEDACRFELYANPAYGEYIALTTPYTQFLRNSMQI